MWRTKIKIKYTVLASCYHFGLLRVFPPISQYRPVPTPDVGFCDRTNIVDRWFVAQAQTKPKLRNSEILGVRFALKLQCMSNNFYIFHERRGQ